MILLLRGEQRISSITFFRLFLKVIGHGDISCALNTGTIELFLGVGLGAFCRVIRAIVIWRPVSLRSEEEFNFAAAAIY